MKKMLILESLKIFFFKFHQGRSNWHSFGCVIFAALHHNNCMFIAHHIQTMDRKFKKKVGQLLDGPPLKCASMVELVPRIRKLGNDNFTTHIVLRKQDLLECLAIARGE